MRNEERYFVRGERMFEANCVCKYDLLSFIPSLGDPAKTIKQDTTAPSPAGTRKVLLEKSRTAVLAFVTAIVCVTSASAQVPPAQAPPAQAPPTAQGTQAQNPLTPLWGVINENYTNFEMGPLEKMQNILIVEPVIPLKLTPGWNLITRWNTPIIRMPQLAEPVGPFPGIGAEFGLSNMQPQFFFTPVKPGSFSWAVGPSLWLPTSTDTTLGINKWGGGPVVVALTIQGSVLAGFLAQNLWAGTHGTSVTLTRVNTLTVMPFVFYNFPGGWFVTYRPLITADWTVDADNRWTVPIGGGFGRVFPVGDMVMDIHGQGFYNGLTSPAAGITNVGKWSALLVVHFLFPKAPVPSL
jgi:hypothetical protein